MNWVGCSELAHDLAHGVDAPGRSRACERAPLGAHERIEAREVDRHAALGCDLGGQLHREAERVVQRKASSPECLAAIFLSSRSTGQAPACDRIPLPRRVTHFRIVSRSCTARGTRRPSSR